MELISGEKKEFIRTDIGFIPEDWEVYELGELGDFKNGINKGKEAFGHGSPFVNLMDVFGVRSISDVKHLNLVDSNPSEKANYSLRKGDVLFVRSSVKPSGVGLTTLVDEDLDNAVYSGFLIRFRERGKIFHEYKAYCFHDPGFRNRLIAKSSVSANTNINQDSLKLLKIALPPTLAEQQAIASALSDVDELICSLDTLIQKKEAIKKGTMQQLLSGNKRLPGFDIEWEVKALGDLFEITSSKRVFKSEWEKEGIPFYRARELAVLSEKGSVDNDLFIDRKLFEKHKSSYGVPQIGDLLVTGVGTLGKVYLVSNNNEFYFKDGNIIWFRINEKVNPEFLMHLYSSPIVIKQINESSAGSTVGTYTITAANKTKIPFPSLEEQKAIAQILSDMDREIQSLHRKREKVGQIKQGMMQELLTGRVRLV